MAAARAFFAVLRNPDLDKTAAARFCMVASEGRTE
jgi:hypothetical protein